MRHPNLVSIGKVAIFYIPTPKLKIETKFGPVATLISIFLIKHFNAYSCRTNYTTGFWRNDSQSNLIRDDNSRFEVSFEGRDRVFLLVDFLSCLSTLIEEECIYLLTGGDSWLVTPKENCNEIQGFVE